jgi:hypothetical protein
MTEEPFTRIKEASLKIIPLMALPNHRLLFRDILAGGSRLRGEVSKESNHAPGRLSTKIRFPGRGGVAQAEADMWCGGHFAIRRHAPDFTILPG